MKVTMRNICQSMNYLGSEICGRDLWILQIEFLGNKVQISLPASNPILVEMRKRSFQTRLIAFIKWNTGNEQSYIAYSGKKEKNGDSKTKAYFVKLPLKNHLFLSLLHEGEERNCYWVIIILSGKYILPWFAPLLVQAQK